MFVWEFQYNKLQEAYIERAKEIQERDERIESLERHNKYLESQIEELGKFDDFFALEIWCAGSDHSFSISGVKTYFVANHLNYYMQKSHFNTDLHHISVFGENDRFIGAFNNVIAFKVITE